MQALFRLNNSPIKTKTSAGLGIQVPLIDQLQERIKWEGKQLKAKKISILCLLHPSNSLLSQKFLPQHEDEKRTSRSKVRHRNQQHINNREKQNASNVDF